MHTAGRTSKWRSFKKKKNGIPIGIPGINSTRTNVHQILLKLLPVSSRIFIFWKLQILYSMSHPHSRAPLLHAGSPGRANGVVMIGAVNTVSAAPEVESAKSTPALIKVDSLMFCSWWSLSPLIALTSGSINILLRYSCPQPWRQSRLNINSHCFVRVLHLTGYSLFIKNHFIYFI